MVRQGDVFWLDLGTPAGSGPGLRRPVVVVQNDDFNSSGLHTTLVCPLTSETVRAGAPGHVLIARGEGGLPRDSVSLPTQLATVDVRDLDDYLGSLPPALVQAVVDGIVRVVRTARA